MPSQNLILFNRIHLHLLEDKKPSIFLNEIVKYSVFEDYPYNILSRLVHTPQSDIHHPEGSVWNHTLLVVNEAAKRKKASNDVNAFMWAALLHDVGKATTTKLRKGKFTSYDHDKVGATLAGDFLTFFNVSNDFKLKVTSLVRWHMQILFIVKNMPFADIENLLKNVAVDEIALLSLCDRLGRGNMYVKKIEEEKENVKKFVEICNKKMQF